MVALIDCNNFYASCERVFNPGLIGKPVVVLSNNDGCVIARSQEAKDIGIKMGEPAFMTETTFRHHQVAVFSSNYVLYGDMSDRVYGVIRLFIKEVEVYSIDEAFADMSGVAACEREKLAFKICDTIKLWLGLQVSIGIAPTKVLAKVANKIAKGGRRVVYFNDDEMVIEHLRSFSVEDLWGIGLQSASRLAGVGVKTALQLRELSRDWLIRNMSVVGLRIALELQGIACIPIEMFQQQKKNIGSAKEFSVTLYSFSEVKEALVSYVVYCATKLRKQGSAACAITITLETNPYGTAVEDQYAAAKTIIFNEPTNFTPVLIKYAMYCLRKIFKPGYAYHKAGVTLLKLVPEKQLQGHLFDKVDKKKMMRIQKVVDHINAVMNHSKVQYACQGFEKRWSTKREMLSGKFTTSFDDLIVAQV